jgi:predicted component of type VI protein secretion system
MALQLEIVSEHRDIVGDDAVREFRETGGTIGRSLQNDWILPDPDRFISGRHASIDFKGGVYYLLDTSSNGVYVNGDCEPIGKGKPRRLFNGDKIRFGDFEMVVSIDSGEDLEMPEQSSTSLVSDDIAQMVPEDALETGVELLDAEEITGDDDFCAVLVDDSAETSIVQLLDADDDKPQRTTTQTDTDLLDSFLDGLGISRSDLQESVDDSELMQNAGAVMREFVEGTSQLLASRANLKNTFRLDQTIILPRHNNPLKLSVKTVDSIKQLLIGNEGEYIGPQDAVREVCRDLLFHQDAFLDAMKSAFVEFADRFDPDELQQEFDSALGTGPLSKIMGKKKYWDLYCDTYPIITDKSGGDFPQKFAENFVEAYEREISEYQRANGGEEYLRETVVLDESEFSPDDSLSDQ